MALDGKSNYYKIETIHDFVCRCTDYKEDYATNTEGASPHSAYAALIEGNAVCQGYATLFYRLCLEAGLDARLIAGTVDGDPHGWNIVKLGKFYYYVDTTWDDGDIISLGYFLKGTSDFPGHTAYSEYETEGFKAAYPMAETAYSISYFDEYPENVPSFVKASLLLTGYIGVNFLMKLPEIPGVDYSTSWIQSST